MTPDESAVDYSVTTLQSTSTSDNIPMDNPSNNSALTAILTHQGNTNVLYSRATLVCKVKCFLKLHIRNNKFIYFCITVTENSSMSKPTICNCVNCNTSAKKSESFEDESAASTSSHSPFSCGDKYLTNIGRGMYLICMNYENVSFRRITFYQK